jgi:hypothetical protein
MAAEDRDDGSGRVEETYVAALQHGLVDYPADARLVGVVRRPTGWFSGAVDENRPELGPPEDLLDRVKDRQESLERQGLCDEEAHNAAWEEEAFSEQYLAYLETAEDARETLAELADLVRADETVVLVCFEGEKKRCHRHLLVSELTDRVDG